MRRLIALLAVTLSVLSCLRADEGLWLWNQFPREALKTKHGFDATPEFLDHLRLASVRIGGETGAFVSPAGLLVTTRQVANTCAAGDEAFSAIDNPSERRCAGLDASVLVAMDEITTQVKAAGSSLQQRNTAIAKAEKDCAAKTGNVCSVVRLFAGSRYDLYQYKRYSDIRMVFAPEAALAFFGRERDSITYLRYGLNAAFFRAWENGKPASTPNFLKWNTDGVKDGDLVLASGNPAATSRSVTAAQLTFLRDTALPLTVGRLQLRIQSLGSQSVPSDLVAAFKSSAGRLIGLRDDRLVTRKTVFDQKIRRAVEGDSKLGTEAAKVWDDVATAYKKWTPFEKPYQILEQAPAPGSKLYRIARQQLRGQPPEAGRSTPDGGPVNEAVEIVLLTQWLEELKALGDKEVPLKALLGGRTPKEVAENAVHTTRFKDPASRTGRADDPLLRIAALIEPHAQKLRERHAETIGALEVTAAEKIAQYRLKLFGAADYPDGTSTPRVAFGLVSGYTDRAAIAQPFASTFSGLYYRLGNSGPWQVPQNWLDLRPSLAEVTPLDFVTTTDTGGGSYGGPVVNRGGELVGITFDGNLESLPNVYLYTGEQARAVQVDVRGIAEALRKVYKATGLLRELIPDR